MKEIINEAVDQVCDLLKLNREDFIVNDTSVKFLNNQRQVTFGLMELKLSFAVKAILYEVKNEYRKQISVIDHFNKVD